MYMDFCRNCLTICLKCKIFLEIWWNYYTNVNLWKPTTNHTDVKSERCPTCHCCRTFSYLRKQIKHVCYYFLKESHFNKVIFKTCSLFVEKLKFSLHYTHFMKDQICQCCINIHNFKNYTFRVSRFAVPTHFVNHFGCI